ncbi:hypothetical protein ACOMHN_057446 [Nucella lapillus]
MSHRDEVQRPLSALDISAELEVQSVWCCHLEAKVAEGEMSGHVHHWDHLLYLTLLIVKVHKLGREVRVEAMEDSLQLEWSTRTFHVLSHLLGAFRRPRAPTPHTPSLTPTPTPHTPFSTPHTPSPTPHTPSPTPHTPSLTPHIPSGGGGRRRGRGCSICRSVAASHSLSQSAVAVDVLKVLYLRYTHTCLLLKRMSEVSSSVVHIHEVKANYTEGKKELRVHIVRELRELRVHIVRELRVDWTTSAHMCLLQGLHNMAALMDRATPPPGEETESQGGSGEGSVTPGERSRLMVNVLIHADIHLSAALSRNHRLSLHTHSLLVTATLPTVVMEVRHFVIRCDDHDILSVQVRHFVIRCDDHDILSVQVRHFVIRCSDHDILSVQVRHFVIRFDDHDILSVQVRYFVIRCGDHDILSVQVRYFVTTTFSLYR